MSEPLNTLAVLRFLAAAYSNRWKPTPDQLTTWAMLLADVPPEDLQRAAVQYAQSHEHPPSVAELRRLALPQTAPVGDEAFEWARKASRHASPYSSERCSEAWAALEKKDPVAAEACRTFGGFSAFWNMASDDVNTSRAQFRSIYDSMKKREKHGHDAAVAQRTLEQVLPRAVSSGDGPRRLL